MVKIDNQTPKHFDKRHCSKNPCPFQRENGYGKSSLREKRCAETCSVELSWGATPESQIPLAFAKERRLTNSPSLGSQILPGNVEPVRYEHPQNLSSLRAPDDQDTQQNTRPPFTPFEVKPFQRSFLPRGPSLSFILKGLCHEPSSSVIIPVIATHDGFSNWRINLSEKMDDGQF